MELRKTHTVVLNQGSPQEKRDEILQYFHATFDVDEKLYETLGDADAFYARADRLRHPLIFYYGHTAAFFINKLMTARAIEKRVNPAFESLFAVGVDEMSWDDLDSNHYDWPTPHEVKLYRDRVRHQVDRLIRSLPLEIPIAWNSPFWAILMGIEHERIHLETSSVLIRELPIEMVRPHDFWEICRESGVAPANELVPVPGGKVVLGKGSDHPLYGWDNEYGHHEALVPDFAAARYLVSNREFLPFVESGGYGERQWWTDEGWNWRNFREATHPLFWVKSETGWRLRTMLEEIDLPWDWPVEVNYLEAKAFCNWLSAQSGKAIRLPTEDEWMRLRDLARIPDQPAWHDAPANINLECWSSSCPVTCFSFGHFFDVIGNVWQWTETPIYAFNGFRVHPWYDDFSTPTFDNRHNLIKGGSWISTGNEATRDARYAFRRHFFQHAGFRYVESATDVDLRQQNQYETDALASQYCDAHYGPEHFAIPNFPKRCAEICLELMKGRRLGHALDIGCAVGRASFELARGFDQVTGLDFSSRFFRLATVLQEEGVLRYALPEEGEILSYHEVTLSQFGLAEVRDKVHFFQGDACNLPDKFTGYDLVLAANLIDRLYSPRRFLEDIRKRLNPGALLVITSPYSWSEEFTAKDQWLGGCREAGENIWSLDGLKAALTPQFRMLGEPVEVPFVIREASRKFQHSIAELTVWELQ